MPLDGLRGVVRCSSVPPQTRYARSGNVNIAYQIAGAGTVDLLMIPGWVTHLALDWHEPRWVRWFERMTAFARIIRFDKRGTGVSDRPLGIPTADERMADALAVMDAVGVARAHVLGWSEGGPLGVMVAATYPERVKSLTLYRTQATFRRRHDYPFGDEESEAFYGELERDWGSEVFAREFIPDADPAAVRASRDARSGRRESKRRGGARTRQRGDGRSGAARFRPRAHACGQSPTRPRRARRDGEVPCRADSRKPVHPASWLGTRALAWRCGAVLHRGRALRHRRPPGRA